MILFTKHDLFTKCCMMGMVEKLRNEKNPRLVALPSPFYDMEVDCFPVSENVEKQTRPKCEEELI